MGWEAIVHLAPEFYNPRRDLPRSAVASVVIVGILYLSIAFVTIATGAYLHGAGALGITGAASTVPLAVLMGSRLGTNAATVRAFLALLICTGTVNAYIASASRLAYGLGRDGALPSSLHILHQRYRTPHRALTVLGSIAAIGLLVTGVFNLTLADLVWIPNALVIAMYIVGASAGIRLLPRHSSGHAAAWVSLLACLAAFPFVGRYVVLPVSVAALCVAYCHATARKVRSLPEPDEGVRRR